MGSLEERLQFTELLCRESGAIPPLWAISFNIYAREKLTDYALNTLNTSFTTKIHKLWNYIYSIDKGSTDE